jgi:TolB-like protein
MKKAKWILFIFIVSCTQTKQVANFKEIAAKHKTVALLPADARFVLNGKEENKLSQSQLLESELKLGFMVQGELNNWFQKNNKLYTISVQNIKKTNELLFAKGMSFSTYKTLSKDSLASILGVDAVVFCDISLALRYRDGEYIVSSLIIGGIITGSQYKVITTLGVVEKNNPITLWQKRYEPNGKHYEDIFGILRRMLKTAAIDFPYKKK